MDPIIERLLGQVSFFNTGLGVLALAALAATLFLFWEWRSALVTLIVLQVGVAALMVEVHHLPLQWAGVQILVILLCVLLLSLSAMRLRGRQALRPPGPWLLRLMVLVLLVAGWRVFDMRISIPLLNPPVMRLFLWLGLCAITTLSLSDSPLYTAIALLLWAMPVQAIVEMLTPGHTLFALIGMVQIVITLACSYLLLIELAPAIKPAPVPTDISFPQPIVPERTLPAPERRLLPERSSNGPRSQPVAPAATASDSPAVARGSQ
jgi:hypothetical protein